MSVAVLGAVALDDIATPLAAVEGVLGGSASYAAAAAVLLTPAQIVSVVGDDLPPATLAPLAERGVGMESVGVAAGATFRWGCRYGTNHEDRETLFTRPGVFANTPVTVAGAAARAPYVCLTAGDPRQTQAALPALLGRRVTLLDTIEREVVEQRAALLALMRAADIVTMNEHEAALLLGPTAPAGEALAERTWRLVAAQGPRTLLLKRGARGATVMHEGERIDIGAVMATQLVDPTGAGDSFAGGVLSALARGAALIDAVRWGSAVASCTVEGFGLSALLAARVEEVAVRAARIGLERPRWLVGAPA